MTGLESLVTTVAVTVGMTALGYWHGRRHRR
jgi:hypothetical protein